MMELKHADVDNTCIICRKKNFAYDFLFGKFHIEKCSGCGFKRMNPQPTDNELAGIYSSDYFIGANNIEDQSHTAMLKSYTADQYLDLLAAYASVPLSGNLLEIGCGHGDFLAKAAARGLSVTGIEYSQHAVDIAAKKVGDKGRIICGEITHLVDSGDKFDFIVFADVLEHVRDPRELLGYVRSLLRENGIAVVIVPSLDSFTAKVMRRKWAEYKLEHLWYFSKNTLKQLLNSEGFETVAIHPAKKTLSFDYIAEHFTRYPVQPFTSIFKMLQFFIPNFLRKQPFRVVASGVVQIVRKKIQEETVSAA